MKCMKNQSKTILEALKKSKAFCPQEESTKRNVSGADGNDPEAI